MTLAELWQAIQQGGAPFLLLLILVTGFREMWVWGYLYRSKVRECDEWKELALAGTSLAKRGVQAGERVARGGGE